MPHKEVISLVSNYDIKERSNKEDDAWSGFATGRIIYPGIETCITVTFLLPGGVISGCHLYRSTPESDFEMALKRITVLGKNAKKMYLIGMLTYWTAPLDYSRHNATGVVFSEADGGSLITRLRAAANFKRPLGYCDLFEENIPLTIEAVSAGDSINFSHSVGQKTIETRAIGGDIVPQKMCCIIL